MLINYVNYYGAHDFSECSKIIQGRNNKQCRERWFNVLNPRVIKGEWSLEEDYLIFRLFTKFGGKWIKFIPFFNGLRAENSIKNRFYSTIRRFNTVLRKKKKEMESEAEKVETIYNDFKSQLIEKYNISSEKDLAEFEFTQLGFNGSLDETRKNTREIFINNSNKEKLGTNISSAFHDGHTQIQASASNKEIVSEKSRFFLSNPDTSTNKSNHSKDNPCQTVKHSQSTAIVSSDSGGNTDFFRSVRKSIISTKVGVRKTSGDIDCQGKTSKTPFVKVKYPLKILNQTNNQTQSQSINQINNQTQSQAYNFNGFQLINPSPITNSSKQSIKPPLTPLISLNQLYSKEGCSEMGKLNQNLSLNELEKDILSLCERTLFTFKDEQSRFIEDKLQKLTENYSYDPFKLSYDTTNITELSSSLLHDSLSQSSFSGILKQMNDLESLIINTKSQILENYSSTLKQVNAVQAKMMFDYNLLPIKNFEYENDSLVPSNEMLFDYNFADEFYGNSKM